MMKQQDAVQLRSNKQIQRGCATVTIHIGQFSSVPGLLESLFSAEELQQHETGEDRLCWWGSRSACFTGLLVDSAGHHTKGSAKFPTRSQVVEAHALGWSSR